MTVTATTRPLPPPTSLEAVPVEGVMHVGFVGCPLETPLPSVARLMAERRVHCVVGFGDVTEDDTRLWGVVSDIDVVSALAAGGGPVTAGEIASTEIVTIEPHESILRATELMRDHEVAHLLVVDGVSDRPIGIVSTLDVMAIVGSVDGLERADAGSAPVRMRRRTVDAHVERYVIAARLKPGGATVAEQTLLAGPPFDPAEAGLSAHAAYLSNDSVYLVFEGEAAHVKALHLAREHFVNVSRWQSIVSDLPSRIDDVPGDARCLYRWAIEASP